MTKQDLHTTQANTAYASLMNRIDNAIAINPQTGDDTEFVEMRIDWIDEKVKGILYISG